MAVGLLFAGSDQATIHNPIQPVLDSLNVSISRPSAHSLANRQASIDKAQAIRQSYQEMLMSKENVVGVGVGLRHQGGKRTDEVGLVVFVRQKVPKALLKTEDVIPDQIEGIPVDVKEVGELGVL